MALCAAAILLILGLMIALIAVCETYRRAALPATATSDTMTASEAATTADLCLTPGCIGTPAHTFKKIAVLRLGFCLLLNRRKVSTWLEKVCGNFDGFFLFAVFLEFIRLLSGPIFVLYRARDNNIFCH